MLGSQSPFKIPGWDFNRRTPKRYVLWVNAYWDTSTLVVGSVYPTRAGADTYHRGDARIACIRIEFEEGEGL